MTQLPGGRAVDSRLERRIAAAVLVVLVAWLLLIARLFYLQVVHGERYRDSAEGNSVRTHRVVATRGMIFDRIGEILVDSRPGREVAVVPHETRDLKRTLERVAALMGLERDALLERAGDPQGRARFQALTVARDADRAAVARVRSRLWALEGVFDRVVPIRDYRFGSSAAHVLGWLGEISAEELQQRAYQGYRPGDPVGKGGVERLLDAELRGRDGGRNVLVDAYGREREPLGEIEPQPGRNVILTLDHRLQEVAERQFDELGRNGAAAALDPRTGEVLLLLSRPSFDPNAFAVGLDHDEWNRLAEDPGKPLMNRALQGLYPPGSTYKVVTALAGLETGLVNEEFEVTCAGSYRLGRKRYRCWRRGGHGPVRLQRAIAESCDVFFYRVGHELGIEQLAYYARALGLGEPTGIDVGAELAGLVPTPSWKRRRYGEPWVEGETLSVAIGQGANLLTPLQLLTLYSSIGTGGLRYRPFLIRALSEPSGRLIWRTEPVLESELPFATESLDRLRSALHGVVHDQRGTGAVMRHLPGGVEAAGKTGTAQVVALGAFPAEDEEEVPLERRDHAWFVTYAPAQAPRIAVVVLVEHGGHGASAAAPIAREIVARFLENERRDLEAPALAREVAALGS